MSSPERRVRMNGMTRRRALGLAAAAFFATPLIGACQFQPLYGTATSGGALQDVMKSVEVPQIPGRVGQRVRNELIFGTTGGGYPAEPQYRLSIVIRESVSAILVEQTGDAQGQQYHLEANFQLVRLTDNSVVLQGHSKSRTAFDKFEQIYANVRAQIDAENRAARVVADDIKTRLAAFLSRAA